MKPLSLNFKSDLLWHSFSQKVGQFASKFYVIFLFIFVFDFPSFFVLSLLYVIFLSSIMFLQRSFAFLPFKSQARMGLVSLFYGSLGLNCPVFLVLLCSFIYPNIYLLYIYLNARL